MYRLHFLPQLIQLWDRLNLFFKSIYFETKPNRSLRRFLKKNATISLEKGVTLNAFQLWDTMIGSLVSKQRRSSLHLLGLNTFGVKSSTLSTFWSPQAGSFQTTVLIFLPRWVKLSCQGISQSYSGKGAELKTSLGQSLLRIYWAVY